MTRVQKELRPLCLPAYELRVRSRYHARAAEKRTSSLRLRRSLLVGLLAAGVGRGDHGFGILTPGFS